MKLVGLIFVLLMPFSSQGVEYMKILKVKGKKAVVKLPDKDFQKGQQVALNRGVWSDGMSHNGRRDFRAELEADVSSTSVETETSASSSSASSNNLSLELLLGFNKKVYEYGPTFSYSSVTDDDDDKTTAFAVGGYLEYNFVENIKGEKLIPFIGARVSYISGTTTTASSDTSGTGLAFGAEGGLKSFPFNDHFFIKYALQYTTTPIEYDNDSKITTNSSGLVVGLGGYF